MGINQDKTVKLDLSTTNVRDDGKYHSVEYDPNDPFCTYNIYVLYIRHLPENWGGTLLRKGIPYNLRKNIAPNSNGVRQCARLDKDGGFGVNDCNVLIKNVALRCNLENPLQQKASGRRRAGITKLCGSSLSAGEVILAARHKTCHTNSLYQIEDPKMHKRQHEAQRYKVSFFV